MSVSLDSYVVKRVPISASASGSNIIVPAVAGKQIWVLKIVLIAAGTVTARFESNPSGNDLSGDLSLSNSSGFALAQEDGTYVSGHFATHAGQSLNLNLSGAVSVGGFLTYIEVEAGYSSSSCSSCSSSSCSSSSSCRSSSSSSSSSSCRSSSSSSRSSSSSSCSSSSRSSSSSSCSSSCSSSSSCRSSSSSSSVSSSSSSNSSSSSSANP